MLIPSLIISAVKAVKVGDSIVVEKVETISGKQKAPWRNTAAVSSHTSQKMQERWVQMKKNSPHTTLDSPHHL